MNICAKLNICALNAPTSQSPKPLAGTVRQIVVRQISSIEIAHLDIKGELNTIDIHFHTLTFYIPTLTLYILVLKENIPTMTFYVHTITLLFPTLIFYFHTMSFNFRILQ